jgi:Sugar (and other) transporter
MNLGDWVGRRWGLIQDATIMFLGLVMLTAAWGVTENGWVICYAWSLLFYGIGVGGEYPMTATSGMENAVGSGKISTKEDRLHRGRKVTSAFLMQGWGQFFNQALLIVLLIIFNSGTGDAPYLQSAVQWTYRLSFAIPAVGTLWLVYYRAYKMKYASKQLIAAKAKSNVTGYDKQSLKLTFTYFAPRIIATSGGWFANDVFFYGNKLFQSDFIAVLEPGTKSVIPNWLWNLVNVGVSLAGYYLASFLIDNKLYGRKKMQLIGFGACFIAFVVPAFQYHFFKYNATHGFQAMYFLSSFFNQFGPNCVTFLVAAEVFPTPIRATAHGFSAACGKLGALVAAVAGSYLSPQNRFYFVPWFGLLGMLVTLVFLPDTTGLDLKEQERRWQFIRAGREHEYHGVAVHPKHLSMWERMRGVGKYYDQDLDYRQKIEDLRSEWEEWMAARAKEGGDDNLVHLADSDFSDAVSTYFDRSPAKNNATIQEREKTSGDSSPQLKAQEKH